MMLRIFVFTGKSGAIPIDAGDVIAHDDEHIQTALA